MPDMLKNLQALLARGQDNALLRFAVGSRLLENDQAGPAIEHLRAAVQLDPEYSAAWKLLGKALHAAGEPQQACTAFSQGLEVAQRKGDLQAVREMQVFLKRAQKSLTRGD